ncbi:early nodulin-like protein 1, partial [Oryza brachyantha]|uniref:early nodulin-like protein 1 n=1 Tax=Oryza brachyantha TaxID=4533 RepID=UPI001ADC2B59
AIAVAVTGVLAASCCEARDFYVGGRDGWTANPAEPYNRWAERNRFQVNDRLVFRYSKEKDSVVVVSQSHYDACNATDPILRDVGGDSTFVFDSSGPFFFISGDAARCQAGERLIVVVLAVRSNATTSPSPPPPPPAVPAPTPRSPPPPAAGTNGTAPPVPAPAPAPGAPPSPAGGNSTSPAPTGTNGTSSSPPPPRPSSASSHRGGALLLLAVIAGALMFS